VSSTELAKVSKGLETTRTAIEKLIASTSKPYELEKLSGILADLKTAQNELNELNTGN
jgi:hypothetical protein